MDLKTTFLNDIIGEEIYIEQSEDFEVHGRDSHVCRLRRELYGLKQAPRAWYAQIDSYLLSVGFTKSEVDPKGEPLILVFYGGNMFQGLRSS